jgi:UDP-N-acetylmuramoyl-tripeptide--D-alanyl-D-alanine ligase
MRNVSLSQIMDALSLPCVSLSENPLVLGFKIDSKLVQPGELFFALKGAKTDGHFFLAEAKQKGALGAVVAKGYQGPDHGLILLHVEDTSLALAALARQLLLINTPKIVGITGSVGKTTTKDFIATLLEKKYRIHKSLASHNTKLTFPLSILNRKGDEEVLVLEMGMSEPGDLDRLLEIAPPDIAVLTQVALCHAAFFPGGVAEIAAEKAKIFSSSKLKTALFYHDFYQFPELIQPISQEKLSFSLKERAADYFLAPSEGKYVLDERGVRAHQFDLPFHSTHMLHNFAAAVGVARILKMGWDEISAAAHLLELPKMRFEMFEKEGITFINDAYNANPESMRAALTNLPQPKGSGKRIAVLGTMKELGSFSKEAHEEMGLFAQSHVDHLLVLGEEAAPLCETFLAVKKPAELFTHSQKLAHRLSQLMRPGDVVLIKGSRSLKMEHIFDLLP